ncbi:MAG: LysR family transcriptional activator of nhaA [Gammaproteobacteria bacterium]|jgi:LysR family transcriptional activator of nhaA
MNNINLKHLHYFWVVAQEGSIVAASERLFVTPQTISAQLKQLEKRLPRPLLKRQGNGITLTQDGELALEYADAIFDLSKELTAALESKEQGGGQIRVGVVDVVPKIIATLVLMPITELSPAPRLICREADMSELLILLAQQKLDFVVSDHPAPVDENLRLYSHEMGSTGISFMAARSLLANAATKFPGCLSQLPILLPGRTTALRMSLENWLRDKDVQMQVAGEFDDSALIKSFGQIGTGVFTCPSAIESEVSRQYGVSVIGRTDEILERFYIISATKRLDQSLIGNLLEHAKTHVFS